MKGMRKITFNNALAETMLIPLWARAVETQKKEGSLLYDSWAVELVNKLDYDFSKFKNAKGSQAGTVVRGAILDREVGKFIQQHPNAVCINIACGLCTRFYRLDNGQIEWYNLDLPEVIETRRKLIPPHNHEHLIGQSFLDESWPEKVRVEGRPVVIIMEGVCMYLTEAQMRKTLAIFGKAFPHSELFLEIMVPFMLKMQKYHDSVDTAKTPFLWAVQSGKDILPLASKLNHLNEWDLYSGFRKHWGVFGVLSLIPWFKHNFTDKIVHLVFR